MELKIPSPEQAYWGLRAMKTVALADGTLDDAELHLLGSVQQIFGTTHAPEQLSPISRQIWHGHFRIHNSVSNWCRD
jgi:hypothetical protein